MAAGDPQPLGFPNCGGLPGVQPRQQCPYVQTGPLHVCLTCARQGITAPGPHACPVCSQSLTSGFGCSNNLCRLIPPARAIDRIHAIGTYSGHLANKIKAYKYYGASGWALIFGRLVTGWLLDNARPQTYGLIIANPTFPTAERPVHHTQEVLEVAAAEDQLGLYPFDTRPTVVSKTRPTAHSAGGDWSHKAAAARDHAGAIAISNTSRIVGRTVLIYDDICTTGLQLDEVARVLKQHGAARVEGLVLARTQWT